MVRRLKEDIPQIVGGFPERKVVQIDLKDLPSDTPELQLSKLLDQYRQVRQLRVSRATKRKQAEAALLVSHLQQLFFLRSMRLRARLPCIGAPWNAFGLVI